MNDQIQEYMRLTERFGANRKALISEYPTMEYMRVFSDRREGVAEWLDLLPGQSILQAGAGYGALTGMLLRKGLFVTVSDRDPEVLAYVRFRAEKEGWNAERLTLTCGAFDTAHEAGHQAGEDAGQTAAEEAGSPAAEDIFRAPDGGFDYILFDGVLTKENGAALIARAKELLKAGGTIIAAADNPYGVRAWAGAETGENPLAGPVLESLLSGGKGAAAGGGKLRRYYAEPSREIVDVVFSDECLPAEGELSRVIPAYGFPEYLVIDPGKKYDALVRDGLYPGSADAFIYLWTSEEGDAADKKGGSPADGPECSPEAGEGAGGSFPVFVKYNRNRRPRYQIRTVIRKKPDGTLFSEKTALSEAGKEHIASFASNRELLLSDGSGIGYVEAEISGDGMTARFPWVKGRGLRDYTSGLIRDGLPAREALEGALALVTGAEKLYNIDAILDNFIVAEDGPAEGTGTPDDGNGLNGEAGGAPALPGCTARQLTGIDYEWVSDEPADRGFVRYRALVSFWEQEGAGLGLGSRRDFLSSFGIGEEDEAGYAVKEAAFQRMAAGNEQDVFLDRFRSELKNTKGIRKTERELRIANERLVGFRAELNEKDAVIKKMTEVKRLTDNHVANLEAIIRDLRHENEEIGKLATYLNSHQTLYSRLRRKAGDAFNRRFPKGSEKRKRFDYGKDAVLHPIRTRQLRSTSEGRNLIEGDFRIGSIYREYGKLVFPVYESPKVSVIIPCYNQVHYTYACLKTILDFTKDVTYEVIIADDVSSDATKDLDRFTENLVIVRNETNQGFLRNCNNAAKRARGQYVMFLNNDTKVTEGWLDWLVKLIESDDTIGMVGSKLVYPDGRLQEAGGIIWSDASGWNYGRLQDPDDPEFNYVKDVDYMSGAAILLSRRLWEEIGGFDDRYAPAYCEDSDLAFEVRRHGYRVVYQPKSVVIHFEGVSNGTDVQGTGLKRYQVENTEKLKEKWKAELASQFENDGNPDPFRARERSGGKKIILVVDHYVPTWDRDAGSRTTYQYLKLFLKMGYVVKFIGDNFAHEEPYTTELEQMGIEVLYGQKMQTDIWPWIERHAKDIHRVYLNRPHIASRYIDFIQSRTDIKVIYYGHDLHFLREMREYELTGDVKRKESSLYWKNQELTLMHKADMSYYPSEVECRVIRKIDPEIRVKAITAYVWDTFADDASGAVAGGLSGDFAKREGLLFVGGFAHPPNRDAVLWFVENVFPKIREKLDVTFYIVGSRAPAEIRELDDPANGIVVKGFVSDEELVSLYRSCRIVVVPLRYGAGVKGKVIEALYYGAPILTTSVGAEGIPEADRVMRISDEEAAFAAEAVSLYNDEEALSEMSRNAFRYIREHNSAEAAWKVIEEDFA